MLNHASTFALSRIVKDAQLLGAELPDAAFDMLRGDSVDAFAAPREQLLDYSKKLTGSRVLDDSYGINNVGIAIKKGQSGRFTLICEFVEESKACGLIADIIKRGDLRGFRVAPSL